jgi:hypothetical protein
MGKLILSETVGKQRGSPDTGMGDCVYLLGEGIGMGHFGGIEDVQAIMKGQRGRMSSFPFGPFHPSGFNPNLLLGVTFRAEGWARCLARFFQITVTFPAVIVIGRFRGNLGVLGVTIPALLNLLACLCGVMALLAVLQRVGMLFVPELSPLVRIRCVKPGIIDSDHILLPEHPLQQEQGSKEQNRSDNGNEFFVHETVTSLLSYSFFHKVPN